MELKGVTMRKPSALLLPWQQFQFLPPAGTKLGGAGGMFSVYFSVVLPIEWMQTRKIHHT